MELCHEWEPNNEEQRAFLATTDVPTYVHGYMCSMSTTSHPYYTI